MAAGICYGCQRIEGNWSWRAPCLLQAIYSIGCVVMLWFTPESPRWLAYYGRLDESRKVLASTLADGEESDPRVLSAYKEMTENLEWERSSGKKLSYQEMVKTPNSRKRIALALSVAVIGMMSGMILLLKRFKNISPSFQDLNILELYTDGPI